MKVEMKLDSLVKLVGLVDGLAMAAVVGVGNTYPQYKHVCDQVVYVGGVVATCVAYVQHSLSTPKAS